MNKAMSPTTATPARISRIIFFMRGSYSGSLQIVYAITAGAVLNRCPVRHQNVAFFGNRAGCTGDCDGCRMLPVGQETHRTADREVGDTNLKRYQFADQTEKAP